MRVSQSPVVWRNVGVDESMDGRDPLGLQGMSSRVGIHVETVVMDKEKRPGLSKGEEPLDMFGPTEGAKSSLSKKSPNY